MTSTSAATFVALCLNAFEKDGTPVAGKNFVAYSGTLLQIGDEVFYLTAGHVLRQVQQLLDRFEVKALLVDTFSTHRVTDHAIPFDIRNAELAFIDDDETGVDFGVIPLSAYYMGLLKRNGAIALAKPHWMRPGDTGVFDDCMVLGLPEESTTNDGVVAPTLCLLKQIDSLPDGIETKTHPRFMAQLDSNIEDVTGMSGGPIFGFRYKPAFKYWIIALQSSWLPKQQIVFGCPLPFLTSLMVETLQKLESLRGGRADEELGSDEK